MEMVEVDGLSIAYERTGSGPPLVLAHGFVGDGVSTWSGQLDGLSDEFTVVAWDAPGAGRSAPPPSSFRIADYAGCLAGFVRALRLDRPHVVGLVTIPTLLLHGDRDVRAPRDVANRPARRNTGIENGRPARRRPRQSGGSPRVVQPGGSQLPPGRCLLTRDAVVASLR
jgi:pimeloyl-ACP methyl ester carboxylesterase